MKQIIDVPAGHTVTIKQEGSQLIVETKFVSEYGDEFSTEEKKVSVFDKVKPGDILRTASGDSFFIEGVNRRKAFDAIIVLSYTILTADGALEEISNYTYDRSDRVLSTANYVTEPEKQQLFDALRDKYALMWNGKELVNWRARPGDTYFFLTGGAQFMPARAGLKAEEGLTDKAKEIEDLRKAAYYINRKIKQLEK